MIIYKKKILKVFLMILLIVTLSQIITSNHKTVYAKSWTASADQSIYQGEDNTPATDPEDKDPGLLESYLIDFVISLTDGFYKILNALGITIDSVIYGRVGGHAIANNNIALFTFELQKGNPYGVVGAVIYSTIAGISIIFLSVTIFGKFSVATFIGGSARSRDSFKSSLGTAVLSMTLIILMPYLLDVALYIRDAALSAVSSDGALKLFNYQKDVGLIENFRTVAEKDIVNSLMYLSTVFLSLYLACIYTSYAMSMLVCFIMFPMVCTGMNFDKKLLSQWIKMVFSLAIIPIMDCVLFMIPTFIGLLDNSGKYAVLKVFVCAMVVPARNIIRQIFGLNTGGMDMAGVATMMGVARLAGATSNAVNKYRDSQKAADYDTSMSNYYETMAQNDNTQTASGSLSGNSISANSGNVSPSSSGGAMSTGSTSYMGSGTDAINPNSNSSTSSGSMHGTGINPVAEQFATTQNFEGLKGLSNAKMAELYRQRATDHRAKATASALGSLAGGLGGMGASMFMQPGTAAQFGALGMDIGGQAGGILSEGITKGQKPRSFSSIGKGTAQNIVENAESFSGTVDGNEGSGTDMVDTSGASTDVSVDPTISSANEFCSMNYAPATGIAANVAASYVANNGERLKSTYNDVSDRYKDLTKPEIRNTFKNTVRTNMLDEFNTNLGASKKIRFSPNKQANEVGMGRFSDNFNAYLNNNEKGVLSDTYLNKFDWMPQDDEKAAANGGNII